MVDNLVPDQRHVEAPGLLELVGLDTPHVVGPLGGQVGHEGAQGYLELGAGRGGAAAGRATGVACRENMR